MFKKFTEKLILAMVKIGVFIRPLYLFMPGIVFLAIYYVIIIKLSMGQDMLMQAGEQPAALFFTNVSLILWILVSWFSSRLVSDTYTDRHQPQHPRIYTHFPRLIGYNVAVTIQLAAINMPTVEFALKQHQYFSYFLIALFIAHNGYYYLVNRSFATRNKSLIAITAVLGIGYIVFLHSIFITDHNNDGLPRHLSTWFAVCVCYFLIQIGFIWFLRWRRKSIDNGTISSQTGSRWKSFYNLTAVVAFVLFCTIVFSIGFAKIFGALGCVLLAFAIWVGIICLVKSKTIAYEVRFGIPIFILMVLVGWWFDPYEVRLGKEDFKNKYEERPNVDAYIDKWLANNARNKRIQSSGSYTVYLVIADGGASRAGYWVASVLSKLQTESSEDDPFSNHLLSLAGASGGSVGNAAFYSLLNENLIKRKAVDYTKNTDDFFEGDFLTSTIAHYLGPDLFRHLIPFRMDDRAAALEKSMQEISESSLINQSFAKPVDSIFNYDGTLPMLFINATNLKTGLPGIVSNVKVNSEFTGRQDILSLINLSDTTHTRHMKLSTAAVIGARFPYLSPAGNINGSYLVDGGYFDNSGGGITLELLQHIDHRMNDTTDTLSKFKNKLKFKVLYLSNGPLEPVQKVIKKQEEKSNSLHPLVNDLAAPLLTVLGTYGGQTDMGNQRLERFMNQWKFAAAKEPYLKLNLPMKNNRQEKSQPIYVKEDDATPYPLNWVISEFNRTRIKRNVAYVDASKVLQ